MNVKGLKSRLHIARQLYDLGSSKYQRVRIVFVFFYYLARRKLGFNSFHKVRLGIKSAGRIWVHTVGCYYHMYDLLENFVENEYNLDLPKEASVVVDLGTCSGGTAIYFALKYPSALVYALEPDKRSFGYAVENCGSFKKINVENIAFSDKKGSVVFFENQKSPFSSSIMKRGNDSSYNVKSVNLESLIQSCGGMIDVLKFDIEGAEKFLFSENQDLSSIKYMCGEVHGDLIEKDISGVVGFLKSKNFEVNFRIKANRQRCIIWAKKRG